ncbi:MAG: LETM1 domain-containing protein [Myxococcales bacterium]
MGSADWLLAVVGAVAVRVTKGPPHRLSLHERRDRLEVMLRASGLAYGTGAVDPAVELPPDAVPGARAFAHFVAGLVRLCAKAAALSAAAYFVEGPEVAPHVAIDARRNQLLAILGAVAGRTKESARLFAAPLGAKETAVQRLAAKVATRLSRRYLALGGPFAGLPLHNGLCAIEVRTCASVALAAFAHGRISPAATRIADRAALVWRCVLVELLSGLAAGQENGREVARSMDQVLRGQKLPAPEYRLLQRARRDPRPIERLAPAMQAFALRRFAVEQVLLAALVDRKFDAGEIAFVERLAIALEVQAEDLSALEAQVDHFYRQNRDALAALRLAETPEGLADALTSRLQAAVADNLDRILQEIRETGELAQLLARASGGATLTPQEKTKIRAQLIDVAKTIPALAIFAAPGGMLLLPLLVKLLPFNLLPSSFAEPPRRAGELPPALPVRTRKAGS